MLGLQEQKIDSMKVLEGSLVEARMTKLGSSPLAINHVIHYTENVLTYQ